MDASSFTAKDVRMNEHQRYQHTRIVTVFDKERVANIN